MFISINFEKKFSDYKIVKTDYKDVLVINDGKISNIVDESIDEFCFLDVKKKFQDLLVNDKNYGIILNFGNEIKCDKNISTLKILIQGYDENNDNLIFDTTFLSNPYRYSIVGESIEVSINLGRSDSVYDFLRSLSLKCCANIIDKSKRIFVYMDGNLVYDKIYA